MNDKLALMRISFDPNDFDTVAEGLVSKFGPPYSSTSESLQNKLTGAGSAMLNMSWENRSGSVMYLSSHQKDGSSYFPEGKLIIVTSKFFQQLEADQSARGYKPDKHDL